ncbi:unnamed protein product [Nezara viridula]|uniref:Uncharacterized protein n=1 Tax=Nezara viridula TaxID=85310 RepID=A0A9P0MQQ4_NEZVI|nr:unnamed protein product [Nezara viridula]
MPNCNIYKRIYQMGPQSGKMRIIFFILLCISLFQIVLLSDVAKGGSGGSDGGGSLISVEVLNQNKMMEMALKTAFKVVMEPREAPF